MRDMEGRGEVWELKWPTGLISASASISCPQRLDSCPPSPVQPLPSHLPHYHHLHPLDPSATSTHLPLRWWIIHIPTPSIVCPLSPSAFLSAHHCPQHAAVSAGAAEVAAVGRHPLPIHPRLYSLPLPTSALPGLHARLLHRVSAVRTPHRLLRPLHPPVH